MPEELHPQSTNIPAPDSIVGNEGHLQNTAEENKDIAAMSYIWIMSLFILFFKKDSAFVRFHARQGFVLFLSSILFWFIPFVGRFLELLVLAGAILGFLAAAQGKQKELPLIGKIARSKWKLPSSSKTLNHPPTAEESHVQESTENKESPHDPSTPSSPTKTII